MTTSSTTARQSSNAASSSVAGVDRGEVRAGPFMLTLCRLDESVPIRPPQSPQLRRFTFFTTSAPRREGVEQVYLHMGYFGSLIDAQSLLPAVRRRFPHAVASEAPDALPHPNVWAPELHSAEELTDTQVMRLLEKRGAATAQSAEERASAEIGVLRPEDTSTRRALKEAVVQGAPVFFAVQLDWSPKRIDPDHIPALPLFKTHTLYAMESRRDGRCRFFLRLGFFADAASAKEAAFRVRSKFAAAVVVPVTEQEHTCAHDASAGSLGLAHVCLPTYQAADRSGTRNSAPESETEPRADRPRTSSRRTETLEETLETLAAREMWNADSLSDSGVRHLKVEVTERKSGGS